jgi:hypothetical protein
LKPLRIALWITAAALVLAVAPWPHAYYVGLRFLVCGVSIFAATMALRERSLLVFPFLLAGIVFNPILPAQTTRAIWIVADLVVAAGFLWAARRVPELGEKPAMDLAPAGAPPEPRVVESS